MSKIYRIAKSVQQTNSNTYATLEEVYRLITTSEYLKKRIEIVRTESDHRKRRDLKAQLLPTVELNSVCKGTRKSENVDNMTGYMIMDIDGLGDIQFARMMSDKLFNTNGLGVKMSFVSPSGDGVKVLIHIPELTKDNFKECWRMVDHYVYKVCGQHCDKQTNDIVRLTYFSYDEQAHFADGDIQFGVTLEQFKNMWRGEDEEMKVAGRKQTTPRQLPPLTDEYAKNLIELAREFGEWCDKNRLCLFPCTSNANERGYNLWIGFGAQLYALFGGSNEGLEIFKKCSRHTKGYSESDTENKWHVLPTEQTDVRNFIGTLYNAATNAHNNNFKVWLETAKTRHNLSTSGTRFDLSTIEKYH